MKILVISLPRSLERRAQVKKKLDERHIPFEFLDAVDGSSDHHPYLTNHDVETFLLNRRRKAAPGELGCYVSHLLAWEKCLALNESVVVLEDDFELRDNFIDGLAFAENFLDRVSFVRLEPMESRWFATSFRGEKFSLVKQYKVGMCTTGYIITPKGAANFLRTARTICAPIDLYVRQTLRHKELIHALIPSIVYPTHTESIIGRGIRNERVKGLGLSVRRFAYKWRCAIGSVAVNLVNAGRKF